MTNISDFPDRRQNRAQGVIREVLGDHALGITGPLTADQEKDLERYCRYIKRLRDDPDPNRGTYPELAEAHDLVNHGWRYAWCFLIGWALGTVFGILLARHFQH